MKNRLLYFLIGLAVCPLAARQPDSPGLKLIQTIPLPSVPGRFDHFILDSKHQHLFVTAQGNKTVVVVDLKAGKVIHTIPGFVSPHAGYYRGDTDELLVGDDDGTGKVFRGDSFEPVKTIKLTLENSDGLRLDPKTKLIYVANAYKEDKAKVNYSYLSIIDTQTWEHKGDIKFMGTHIEEIGLEPGGSRLFVATVSRHEIAVIDRDKRTQLGAWPVPVEGAPFGVVFDAAYNRLLVGLRQPGTFVVMNADTGNLVTSLPIKDGMDDMFYDSARRQIYISSGAEGSTEGFVDVIKQIDANHYVLKGTVPTGGASATSLFVPELKRLFVGVEQHGDKDAEIRIYAPE